MFFLDHAWLVPLIPAVSFVVILLFGKRMPAQRLRGRHRRGRRVVRARRAARSCSGSSGSQDAEPAASALGALGRSIGRLGAEGGEAQVLPVLGPARAAQTARREIGGRSAPRRRAGGQRRLARREEHGQSANRVRDFPAMSRERAHAEEPAAARAWLVGAREEGIVALISHAVGFAHAMIDRVGMGKAVDRVLPVAEGKYGRGRHKAKRRERGKRCRQPEAEPGAQCGQHRFRIVSPAPIPTVGPP